MTPEQWQRLRPHLESALEAEPDERERYIEESVLEPELRGELRSILETFGQAGTDFLDPTRLSPARFQGSTGPRIGERTGPYEVRAEIARGGMADVYRASRADGLYTQDVALKFVRAGIDADVLAERFNDERHILASLDHPNIAKLLDAGTTADGLPYFVMELVDGVPITQYCDEKKLTVAERLRLFRTVCGAVRFAHQRLIIHRDLKPSNILVTRDGVPKLLDFGIAKALLPEGMPGSAAGAAKTRDGLQLMTPEYASPEQIQGTAYTTATDIYSLGVVLYELLSGQPAQKIAGDSPRETIRVICDVEPSPPSTIVVTEPLASAISLARSTSPRLLRAELGGDLDSMVMMALRKEPTERYASVEQFDEDIRRHLENLPVTARNSTLRYSLSKFAKRHSVSASITALVALLIVSSTIFALREARASRKQAEIARLQHDRAERRFDDVRKLANSLIYDIHDSVKDVPGTLAARRLIVEKALEYLDSLSKESSDDLALQQELAAAYERVGDLMGNSSAANAGDFNGAITSYKKALEIRERSAVAHPGNPELQAALLSEYFRLAFGYQDAGQYSEALACLDKAMPIAQTLASKSNSPMAQDGLAGIYWKRGGVLAAAGDALASLENFRKSAAIRERISAPPEVNRMVLTHLASDYLGIGEGLARTGDSMQGISYVQKSIATLETISSADPSNPTLQEYLGEAYNSSVPIFEMRGDYRHASHNAARAVEIFSSLHAATSGDALAKDNYALAEIALGKSLLHSVQAQRSVTHLTRAVETLEGIRQPNQYESDGLIEADLALGQAYMEISRAEPVRSAKRTHLLRARLLLQKGAEGSLHSAARVRTAESVKRLRECDAALANL
jgi:eukaryotic-like serine/threonine-protein kinase